MTTTTPLRAARRIRDVAGSVGVFSVVVALAIVGTLVTTSIDRERAEQERLSSPKPIPLAERQGIDFRWSADGSALIVLPAALRGRPLEARLVESLRGVAYGYLEDGDGDDERPLLGDLRTYWTPFASYTDTDLWVTSGDRWSLEIRPLEGVEVEGSVTGTHSAAFVYRGDATSGRIVWEEHASLRVDAWTIDGYERRVAETRGLPGEGPGEASFSWTASPYVVIQVSASSGVPWTLVVDDAPGQPDEAPAADEDAVP